MEAEVEVEVVVEVVVVEMAVVAYLLLHQRAAERVGGRVDEERVHHEEVALLARRLDDLALVLLDELLDVRLQGRDGGGGEVEV